MAKLGEQESKILFSLDPEVFKGFENVRRMFDMHRDEMMNLRTASETFRRVAESLSKPSEAMIESQRSMLRFSEEIKRTNAEAFANIVKLSPVELPAISAISASLAAAQKQYAAMSSVRLPDMSAILGSIASVQKQFAEISRLNSLVLLGLPRIDYLSIRDNFGISNAQISGIKRSTRFLEDCYARLAASQRSDKRSSVLLPDDIANRPQRDFVYHAVTQMSLTTKQADDGSQPRTYLPAGTPEDSANLDRIISKLDPQLISLLSGARATLHNNNPDKVRHFCASLRELFTHIIHKVAPDSELQQWSQDPSHKAQGKFTRRARILYVFRHTKSAALSLYVTQEADLTLKYVDLFQKGTHAIAAEFDEPDLWIILAKLESTLLMILRTHFAFNQK